MAQAKTKKVKLIDAIVSGLKVKEITIAYLKRRIRKGVENAIDNAEYKIVKLREESGKILSQLGHINDENSAPDMGDVLSEYLAKIEEIETYEKNVDRLKTLQNELDTKEIEVEIEEK